MNDIRSNIEKDDGVKILALELGQIIRRFLDAIHLKELGNKATICYTLGLKNFVYSVVIIDMKPICNYTAVPRFSSVVAVESHSKLSSLSNSW